MLDIPISCAPVEAGTDPVTWETFSRKDAALVHTLRKLLPQLEGSLHFDLSQCLAFYLALSKNDRRDIVLHPLFQHWWTRLMSFLKKGDRWQIEQCLQELSRFLVISALKQRLWERGSLRVAVTDQGEIRFPGHALHIDLGVRGEVKTAIINCEGENLNIQYQGRDYFLHHSDLVYGNPVTPLVRQRRMLSSTSIEIDASDVWINKVLDEINAQDAEPPYPKRDLQAFDPVDDQLHATYDRTMQVIEHAWPELKAEISSNVRLIVPFLSKYMVGWTHVLFHGAVFIKAIPGDTFFAIEHLVHEASHVRLYSIQMVAPLHSNAPGDLFTSPLRQDPRPASGVYHGAFVHGRLIEFMIRAAHVSGQPQYARRAVEIIPQFEASLTTLFTEVKLSESGRRLLEELANRVHPLVSAFQRQQEISA